MKTALNEQPAYALGYSQQEMERLIIQAQIFAPFTRLLLEEAGITSGMRVLDVGCGAGEVTFLAAELVGPSGTVVAADLSGAAIECATRRAQLRSKFNVQFVQGDPARMKFDKQFDAVVGRFVLMYCPDPASTLSRLASHVRPGGVVAFQEFDMDAHVFFSCCSDVREGSRMDEKSIPCQRHSYPSWARVIFDISIFRSP